MDLPVAELAKSSEFNVDGSEVLATSATAGKNSSAAVPILFHRWHNRVDTCVDVLTSAGLVAMDGDDIHTGMKYG